MTVCDVMAIHEMHLPYATNQSLIGLAEPQLCQYPDEENGGS